MKKNTLIYLLTFVISAYFINVQASETGIKVHGHWKFDIYHADGSFDRAVKFENALTTIGARSLVNILSKNGSFSSWEVHLQSVAGFDLPCKDNSNQAIECIIEEIGQTTNQPNVFSNLSVINNTNKLTLQGTMTTAQGLSNPGIVEVKTFLLSCYDSPAICALNEFTSKTITPVLLQAGQVVQITVEISFS